MIDLPKEFLSRMKHMLGKEYEEFLAAYEAPREAGLRANTLKILPENLVEKLPFQTSPIPWTDNGYYYPETLRPAKHPYYQCGLYYLQEPSAMTPGAMLPISPGDFVLDLCAAPGGKSTQLGSRLQGKGLLVANDISNSRAKALLRNIELFGITNSVVTNETPDKLSRSFSGFFNKILVDAPCSGEGMFRKEPAVAAAWTPEKPEQCAKIQREIMTHAVEMLMPGGLLLYSTCTFAPIENEGTISYVLDNFPEMELVAPPSKSGFDHGNPSWGNQDPCLANTIRIWPHHSKGEGHFLAFLRKKGSAVLPTTIAPKTKIAKADRILLEDFAKKFSSSIPWERVEVRKDKVYLLPPVELNLRGLHFLRSGVYLGDMKKNRFEPSQQLALILKRQAYSHTISLNADDPRIQRYLKGETLLIEPEEATAPKGWQLLCIEDYPLGWGKLVNGILKNKYPSGWRIN